MSGKLKIDFDVLDKTIETYDSQINGFIEAREGVVRALVLLRQSGWDSGASKVWFELMDTGWLDSMAYHIRVIKELKNELNTAKNNYSEVYSEQERLARNL